MAYLGRISAVLTANTRDFTREIETAGRGLRAFAQQARGLELNLNTRALDQTLTKVQLFQRQLQQIERLQAAGVGAGLPDPGRLRDQFRLYEDLGKPLTAIKNQIEGLASSIQTELYPELGRIQAGFRGLYQAIEAGSTTFDAQASRINSLRQSLIRLRDATAVTADLGKLSSSLNASNVGASFAQPRAREALQRTLALRQDATNVPAQARNGGVFGDLAIQAERNADLIEQQAARVAAVQLRIANRGLNPSRAIERATEQGRLDALTRQQEVINSGFQRELNSAQIRQIVSPQANSEVKSLIERFGSLSASLREINSTSFNPLIASVGSVVEQLNRGAISADRAKSSVEALAAAGKVAGISARLDAEAAKVFTTKPQQDRDAIRRAGTLERNAIASSDASDDRKRRLTDLSGTRQDALLAREEFTRSTLSRVASLKEKASTLGSDQISRQVQDIANNAQKMDSALRKALGSQQADQAAAALNRYKAQLSGLLPVLDRLEKKTAALTAARKQYDMFLSASGGAGDKLDPALTAAASDVMTARQFAGQYAPGNIKGRIAIATAVKNTEAEILRLTQIRQLIEEKSTLSVEKKAAALRRNTQEIDKQTQSLLKQVAAESGGLNSEDQVMAAATRNRKNTGSFGIGGLASAQLAFQQGLFAIDDLVSSTGGLEYKLRAVGNNITQLGLLLGQSGLIPGLTATKGLFIGLAAVLGTQVAIAIGKAAFNMDDAENKLKSLNDTLSKSRSLAEQNTKAFQDLAKAVSEAGNGGSLSSRGAIASTIEERRKALREESRNRVLSSSASAAQASARVKSLEERLSKESDVSSRAAIRQQLDRARIVERNTLKRESTLGPATNDSVRKMLEAGLDSERAGLRSLSAREFLSFTVEPFATAEYDRVESRRRAAFKDRAETPTTTEDAIAAIEKQITRLNDINAVQDVFERMRADYLPEMSTESSTTTEIRRRRELIAQLEEERARLEEDAATKRNETLLRLSETGLVAQKQTERVFNELGNLRLDSDMTASIEQGLSVEQKALGNAIENVEKGIRERTDTSGFEKQAAEAADALRRLYAEADKLARGVALGAIVPTSTRLEGAASQLSSIGPSVVATRVAGMQVDLAQFERDRQRGIESGNTAAVAAADAQITVIRAFVDRMESATAAVVAFTKAAEEAAAALSQTLAREAEARADELRRRANRFAGDPLSGPGSRADADRAKADRDSQRAADIELRARINQERLKFEEEILTGKNPEAAALADRVRAGKAASENKELSAAQQEAGRLDAERAQLELDRLFKNRPGVQQAMEDVDARDTATQRRAEEIRRRNEKESLGLSFTEGMQQRNVDMARDLRFGQRALSDATEFAERMKEARRKVDEAAQVGVDIPEELKRELEFLGKKISEITKDLINETVASRKGEANSVSGLAGRARDEMQGVFASDVQGALVDMEVRRQALEAQRDEALKSGDRDAAGAFQGQLDAQNELAKKLYATAIAVGAFQEAMNKAALSLQNTVAQEGRSAADSARRRANEAEAVFGGNSPEARRARGEQARREREAERAEKEQREARAAIADERVKFEQELAAGQNPAAKARADEIARQEQIAADKNNTAAEREAARARADQLRAEQEAEFRQRPGAQAAQRRADESDAKAARAASAERGRELGRSPEQRRMEDIRRQAGDLGNAVQQMRDEGKRRDANDLARTAAINMAREQAPMYAQFAQEAITARLQGPSRAALNASDIQTGEGARELNRLMRGDNSGKDVNLAEMRKQSNLLEAIEKAVRDSTGVVVNL